MKFGDSCYRNTNYSQAVYWYRKAAEQGSAAAQNHLGDCYYRGYGVTQDNNMALYWYKKAVENEDGTLSEEDRADVKQIIKELEK